MKKKTEGEQLIESGKTLRQSLPTSRTKINPKMEKALEGIAEKVRVFNHNGPFPNPRGRY